MLVDVLMAAQPNSRASARQRERNAQLLSEVLAADEHRLRRQAVKHAELPDDADDALQSAYALFLERYTGTGEPLAWLYTTVKREAWAIRRRSSRRREGSLVRTSAVTGAEFDLSETIPADGPGPGARVIRDELLAVRREAIANLKRGELRALLAPSARALVRRDLRGDRLDLHQGEPLRERGPGGAATGTPAFVDEQAATTPHGLGRRPPPGAGG